MVPRVKIITTDKRNWVSTIATVASYTQGLKDLDITIPGNSDKLVKYLIHANHTSPFEFWGFTVEIQGLSRVALMQLTRHRMASYMSHSFQYSSAGDAEVYTPQGLSQEDEMIYKAHFETCKGQFNYFNSKYGRDTARYLMPLGTSANLTIHMNLREFLFNFYPQRACLRNTPEVQLICMKIFEALDAIIDLDIIKNLVGPQCTQPSHICDQGSMSCGKGPTTYEELYHANQL